MTSEDRKSYLRIAISALANVCQLRGDGANVLEILRAQVHKKLFDMPLIHASNR